ncbi:MAG: hypothetical protein Q9203_006860 [Teloschistes exilis]
MAEVPKYFSGLDAQTKEPQRLIVQNLGQTLWYKVKTGRSFSVSDTLYNDRETP